MRPFAQLVTDGTLGDWLGFIPISIMNKLFNEALPLIWPLPGECMWLWRKRQDRDQSALRDAGVGARALHGPDHNAAGQPWGRELPGGGMRLTAFAPRGGDQMVGASVETTSIRRNSNNQPTPVQVVGIVA
nr:hypothetical protein [uncultured Rhodopila sp.]